MPLMALGAFTFQISTAPFAEIKRSTTQRWAEKQRVGKGAAQQHLGPGEDTITVECRLHAELTGGAENVDRLRAMMATGKAWILTAGTGEVMGRYIITGIDDTRSVLDADGSPRKINFGLTLKRYWDDDPRMLGSFLDSLP